MEKETEFIDIARCKNCKYLLKEGDKLFCKNRTVKNKPPETTLESHCADFLDINDDFQENMITAHRNILDILREYLDLKEEYYNIIALWIMGTYFHHKFNSFPFLFFNAIKGSGKTRTLNLITTLAKDGEMLLSPTEAVLFRTTGTLGIDEFEGVTRQGIENLRELINASYKKGAKVKRMKQKKVDGASEQVVEEFDVYRPITLANIWGMESVLGDRCITLVLERSSDISKTNLIEVFKDDEMVKHTKELLNQCSLCRCSFSTGVYREWNNYIKNIYTNNTNYINTINNTFYIETFKAINLMGLRGRDLELSLPLCLLASEIGPEVLKETTLTLKEIFNDKKAEELIENNDVSLIEFISQELNHSYTSMKKITEDFRMFLNSNEEWINHKWMGRALKRMNLIKEKRRTGRGVEVILDIEKAQQKIKIFRPEEEEEPPTPPIPMEI